MTTRDSVDYVGGLGGFWQQTLRILVRVTVFAQPQPGVSETIAAPSPEKEQDANIVQGRHIIVIKVQ